MKNMLFAAAIAITFVAISPALAISPEEEAAQELRAYPLSGPCHFLKQRVVLPNGHVVFQTHQVCN
jgi:hypothetical protein